VGHEGVVAGVADHRAHHLAAAAAVAGLVEVEAVAAEDAVDPHITELGVVDDLLVGGHGHDVGVAVRGPADADVAGQVEHLGIELACHGGMVVLQRAVQGDLCPGHRPHLDLVEGVGEAVAGRRGRGHHHQLVAGPPTDRRRLQGQLAGAGSGALPGAGPAGLGRPLDVEPAVVVGPEADVGGQHLMAAAPEGALVDADEADRLLHGRVRRHHLEGALHHQVAAQLQAGRRVLGEGQGAAVGHPHLAGAGGGVDGDRPPLADGDGVAGPGHAATPGGGVGPGAGPGRLRVGLGRRREGEQQGERYRRSKP
jgi:hypothetical protein